MNIDTQNRIVYLDEFYLNLTMKEFHACLRDHYHRNRYNMNENNFPYSFDDENNLIFIKKGWVMIAKAGDY